jgi:lipid-A-disaccharide synthase
MSQINGKQPTICLIAADVSGDQNGARLASALRELRPDAKLIAAGGHALREAGVEVLVETGEASMVGPPGSLKTARALVRVWRELCQIIDARRPDVAVLIDNETLNLLLARRLRKQAVPTAFFFPPQVWFWGRWRMRWIVRLSMRILCAFKQEADLYQSAGADAIWTGHPLRDVVRVSEDPVAAMRAIKLDPERPLVVLMPGSRPQEVSYHSSLMAEVARILQTKHPDLQFAVPLASETLRDPVERQFGASGLRDLSIYVPRSYAILSRARAVLQCSGTATIEAALLGIPSAIIYRCSRLHYGVARRFMHVKYIGMPNLLLGEMVQPEFFGARIDPQGLADELSALLYDEVRRGHIKKRLAELPDLLGPNGAIRRAAKSVIELLPRATRSREDAPGPTALAALKAPSPARSRRFADRIPQPSRVGPGQRRDPV